MATLAVIGFAFPVPDSWELTAYSFKPDRGRFHLHTREGFQGQVSWRDVKAQPDLERMAREAWKQAFPPGTVPEGDAPPVERKDHAVWCSGTREEPTWVGIYNFREKRLIEWVFPGTGKEKRKLLLEPIIQGWQDNSGEIRRWALWGLDLNLPADYLLAKVEPFPADVTMTFSGPKDHRVVARRVGFARHQLKTWGEERFLYGALPKGAVKITGEGPHRAFRIGGRRGYEVLLGRRWHGRGDLEHQESANRLRLLIQTAPKAKQLMEPADVWNP